MFNLLIVHQNNFWLRNAHSVMKFNLKIGIKIEWKLKM